MYTLYTEEQFKALADHTLPEITRECLEDVLLTAKAAGVREISKFSWIDPPQEAELGRATSVIRKRGLVDPDEDLTEEGMELYRVARQVTQFIDKYDYSSTRRALDVATLLVLADRYSCLTEAATVLAMMPRMGNSLYWRGDGILIWDRRWDLASKDRIAQIHLGLQAGCNDDLDFACKLFSLYETHTVGSTGSAVNDWCQHHFINAQNLALVSEARDMLVMPFMRGKKDLILRPLEYSLVPRVRLLMAVAWPDRILPLRPGNPVRFVASDSGDIGIVSRLSCGAWHERKDAIIGMMDRGYTFTDGRMRECPTANFLVEVPKFIPENEPAAIAPIFAGMRACMDPHELHARFLADQYAPIGSRVEVELSGDNGAKLVRVLQAPDAFVPNMTEPLDEDGNIVFANGVYEHRVVDTSTDSADDEDEDEVSTELDVLTHGSATEAERQMVLKPYSTHIPLLKGRWLNANRGNEATIEGWTTTNEQPLALLCAIGTGSNESTLLAEVRAGTMIDICLERDVREMDSGRLAGFMARAEGLTFPVSTADLSISLNNPGLEKLKGRNLKVAVIAPGENDSQPRVSLLSVAEVDIEGLVRSGEANGRVVEIVNGRNNQTLVQISIEHNNVVHGAMIPITGIDRMFRDDLSVGEEVTLALKRRFNEVEQARVYLPNGVQISHEERAAMQRHGITRIDDALVCSQPLPSTALHLLSQEMPRVSHFLRRLYSISHELFVKLIETPRSRSAFEDLYKEACRIRSDAAGAEPRVTRERVKDFTNEIKSKFITDSSRAKLREVLQESWKVQQGHSVAELKQRNLELQRRIERNPSRAAEFRRWIAENEQKIRDIEKPN